MSRIGKKPITIPEEVQVEISGQKVKISGPKGELSFLVRPEIKVAVDDKQIKVTRQQESRLARSLHGLSRTLLSNMIKGVTDGYQKTLKLVGTGYRVKLEKGQLVMTLGFSHPVTVPAVPGIEYQVEDNETIVIKGIDKSLVGQTAAQIRALRPPEVYKGKGIRYQDEEVKLKPGKAGKAGAAGFGGETS